jgi:hypothetical protein
MTPEQLIAALRLPPGALVGQRIPKKMLAEHGAASSADRQLLQEHIEEIVWIAALKPASAGVAEYRDAQRSYLELAVLCVTLHPLESKPARVARLAELVHRAIPYPVLLVLSDGQRLHVSLVHIRHAQKEADKTVLDGDMVQAVFERPDPTPNAASEASTASLNAFLAALDLSGQPRADLHALYQGWFDTLCAWQSAAVTGHFAASASPAQAIERRAALRRLRELDAQIASLRASARQEKQIARQVALNLDIKALVAQRQQAATHL